MQLRMVDIVIALLALLLLWPVMVLIAARVAWDRSGPVLYRQQRVGRDGLPISVHKFRTLRSGPGDGADVAADGDPRITRPGRWLRRSRLDELPQLVDVMLGRMALVGPRPETAGNLAWVPADLAARLHAVRPGLTSEVALRFLAEDAALGRLPDPLSVYRRVLVPAKVAEEVRALAGRSLRGDLMILLRTPMTVLSPAARARSRAHVEKLLGTQSWDSVSGGHG